MFPGGNSEIARLIVKWLIPSSLPGDVKAPASPADLLTQRLTVHEQTAWMLRSLLEE